MNRFNETLSAQAHGLRTLASAKALARSALR